MGLKERECGQIGVTMMAGTLGWIIEAPAAAAYAVLPVGVDTITPGAVEEREGRREIGTEDRRVLVRASTVALCHVLYSPSPCTEVMRRPSRYRSTLDR
jgi:hypothetical protein